MRGLKKSDTSKHGICRLDDDEILYVNVDILKNNKYIFFTEVESKPRDTSVNAKLMFREELRDIQALMNMGSQPNVAELEKSYSVIWNKRKEKLFGKAMSQQELAMQAQQGGGNVLNDKAPQLQPGPSAIPA